MERSMGESSTCRQKTSVGYPGITSASPSPPPVSYRPWDNLSDPPTPPRPIASTSAPPKERSTTTQEERLAQKAKQKEEAQLARAAAKVCLLSDFG